MAKSQEKNQARKLRQRGNSIKEIAKILGVSKSSASTWCRDIVLSSAQIRRLNERMRFKRSYEARIKGARVQHERRIQQISLLRKEGASLMPALNEENLFLIGIGIYWGEGMKNKRAGIANSDYRLIKFMMQWFEKVWGVSRSRFSCHILINKIHGDRTQEIERYWSKVLKLPRTQFSKTVLVKRKNKKVYSNFSQHYGTLIFRIRRGTDLTHKINGLIDRIGETKI